MAQSKNFAYIGLDKKNQGENMAKITNKSTLTSKYVTPDGQQLDYQVESNESSTENMTTSFVKQKTSAKEFGFPKDEIQQVLVLTNNSEFPITNIVVSDSISSGAKFLAGSVLIDSVSQPTFNITGFNLPKDLQPNDSTTITYTLVIDESPAVTQISVVSNIEYQVDGQSFAESSNTATIALQTQEIVIQNTADKTAVISGQKITFQNDISNKGTVTNTQVMFRSPIPTGTTFVEGSVEIDGQTKQDFNPDTGFMLEELGVGANTTVKFSVMVD